MKLLYIFTSSQSAFCFMTGQFEYLSDNGFNLTILLPDDGFADKIKDRLPTADVRIIPIERKIEPVADLIALAGIMWHIVSINPAIIHLHTPKAGLLGGLAAKLLFRKNVVFHLHGLVSVNGGKVTTGLIHKFEKLSLTLADKVLAVSPSLKSFCIENNLVTSDKIEVLSNGTINGIDYIEKFSYQQSTYNTELRNTLNLNNRFVLGFLGRVNEDKGIRPLVEVYRSLRKKHNNISLCIVGPNELPFSIESLFEANELDNVLIIDRVESPEHYLRMFDLQLFLSVREGFGLALAEASAVGTPSVAYNIFGIKDAVKNGTTGTLVPFEEYSAAVAACDAYITSPSLLQEHSRNGVKYIQENFRKEDVWHAQKELYLRLLN